MNGIGPKNESEPQVTIRQYLIKKGEDELKRVQAAAMTYYAQPMK